MNDLQKENEFLKDKIILYDLELQRVEKEYDNLEEKYNKLHKQFIETRFELNVKKVVSDKHESQQV